MSFGKGHHLHLIDGSAFIFRAYHALPPLTRKSDGLPIGAVAGFCNMLHRYIESNTGPEAPTHVAVVFDKGSHTFRNDLYDRYKANRDAMPEDLRPQMPLTRSATEAFNIACKELEGFEADDIIATLTKHAVEAGGDVTIISSDKDLMQLVGHNVMLHGCILHDRAFVGLSSTVMNGAVIEGDVMLAAGAMLTQGKRIAARQLWAGSPARFVRDLDDAAVMGMRIGVAHYVTNAKLHAAATAEA